MDDDRSGRTVKYVDHPKQEMTKPSLKASGIIWNGKAQGEKRMREPVRKPYNIGSDLFYLNGPWVIQVLFVSGACLEFLVDLIKRVMNPNLI